jgi:ribonuclease VapC
VIVVDASAIVAMLTREPEADALVSALAATGRAETTPIAIYEAVLGLARKRQWSVAEAETHVGDFLRAAGVAVQPVQPETAHVALEAFARYGKGKGHPARLNLGDCFIYAQAKIAGASLLYKGDDFSNTDIESAS